MVLTHCIAGSWDDGEERSISLIDPRDGLPYGEVSAGDAERAHQAVDAARKAQVSWSALNLKQRRDRIRQVGESLDTHTDVIVRALSLETGKNEVDARAEVEGSIGLFTWYADLAVDVLAPRVNDVGFELRVPYGVAALIVPWNYPVAIAMRSLPALLAAGNAVVWKPSEKTPLSAVEIMRAINDSEALPPGVLNLLLGDGAVGAPLVEHEGVDLVVHTGSTATGRKVAEASGRLLRPAILELGGKDAVIVGPSIDVPAVAAKVAEGAFENTGQICTSMERILVHSAIVNEFVEHLVRAALSRNVGLDEDSISMTPVLGPLIDARQRELVHSHIERVREDGASVLVGGFIPERPGFYYPATVVRDLSPMTPLWREETFGPVAAVIAYESIDEALALVNDSPYGLGATVYSHDEEVLERVSEIRAGIVWVNEWHAPLAGARFEPAGCSGLGTVGPGAATLEAFTRAQQLRR